MVAAFTGTQVQYPLTFSQSMHACTPDGAWRGGGVGYGGVRVSCVVAELDTKSLIGLILLPPASVISRHGADGVDYLLTYLPTYLPTYHAQDSIRYLDTVYGLMDEWING